jgi:hypothetical protein
MLLTACGGTADDPASAPTVPSVGETTESTTSDPATPADASLNERGNLERSIGEEIEFPRDDPVVTMVFDAITPDFGCTSETADPPENGHFLGLQIRVSTAPDLRDVIPVFTVSPSEFTVIGADGITVAGLDTFAALSCVDEPGFPATGLGAGQQYVGTVVLDSPVTSGTLLFQPIVAPTAVEVTF